MFFYKLSHMCCMLNKRNNIFKKQGYFFLHYADNFADNTYMLPIPIFSMQDFYSDDDDEVT